MKQATPIRLPDGSDVYEDYVEVPKKGWLTSLKEKFIGESSGSQPAQVVNNRIFGFFGERPVIPFAYCIYCFERTPQLQTAVYNYADRIFGTELQVNADDDKIKEFLETWNDKTKSFQKFRSAGITTLVCGASLIEKLDEKMIQDIKPVKMSTIQGKKRDNYNLKVEYYMQKINDGKIVKLGDGLPDARDRFVEFHLNYYDENDWGRSLFYSLITERDIDGYDDPIKPLIQVMWQVEEAMGNIFTNHSEPMKYITYAGANKEFIDNQALAFKKRKVGSTFFGDRKPEIDIIESSSTGKYDSYITHLEKAFELGTQFPHDIMTGDFTSRASSQTTDDAIDKRIKSFQTYFLRVIYDEIYIPLLKAQLKLTDQQIKDANIVLAFGTPSQQELSIQEIMQIRQNKDLSQVEVRKYLADNTGIDLDDKSLEDEEEDNLQKQQDMFNQKLQLVKSNSDNQEPDGDEPKPPVKEKKIRKCESCKEGQCTFCTKKSCKCKH